MSLNYIHPNFEKRTKYFALFHATNNISVPFLDKSKDSSSFDVYFSPILPKHFSSRGFECCLKSVFGLGFGLGFYHMLSPDPRKVFA